MEERKKYVCIEMRFLLSYSDDDDAEGAHRSQPHFCTIKTKKASTKCNNIH